MFSLIIPAFNEEAAIRRTVSETISAFEELKIRYELIVVNNGSSDSTGNILRSIKSKSLVVVDLKENAGFGGGLLAGFRKASGDIIGFNCADGQVSPGETLRLLDQLNRRNLSLVKGDRRTKYESTTRRYLSYAYNALVRSIFSLRVKDINGYPVLMKRKVYNALRLTQHNWTISVEILHKARRKGFKITEIPISYGERKDGKSHVNILAVLDMFFNLLMYRIMTLIK